VIEIKSIIQSKKECYFCKTIYNLQEHHCWYGSNRKLADEDKLVVWLCVEHHTGTYGVHGKYGKEKNMELKKIAEEKWIEHYAKTKEDFIKRYGRSVL